MNTTTLEKPKRVIGEPQLSRESWEALRMASISGTSDEDLSAVYEIAETAIRKKRSLDKTWSVAHGLRRQALGGTRGPVSKHVKAITSSHENDKISETEAENKAVQAIAATFADESQVTRMLALQIGRKGMQAALESDGSLKPLLQPTEPAHVKAYADIARIAGSWQPETSITVNCQAFAGASLARNDENENTIMDV